MRCKFSFAVVASVLLTFAASQASATTLYFWTGGTSWTDATAWHVSSATGATGTAPATGGTQDEKLYICGDLTYGSSQGYTAFNVGSTNLTMVVGTNKACNLTIATGGTWDGRSSSGDAIGNSYNGTLTINGGTYINTNGGAGVLYVGMHGESGDVLNVESGVCTVGNLRFSGFTDGSSVASSTVNLDGGVLSVGTFSMSYDGTHTTTAVRTFNFNGGTLKALADSTSYIAGLNAVNVKSGGAIIDTNGHNVTISNALLNNTASTDGGLTKNGEGMLTLSGANTYTGATNVNAGTLSVTGSVKNTSGVYIANAGTAFSTGHATLIESLASGGSLSSTIVGSNFTTATRGTVSGVSAASSISMSWRNRNSSETSQLISDVANVTDNVAGGSYTLTMTYDVATLTARGLSATDASNIYIAYWDGFAWDALTSVVDTTNDTVSAVVNGSVAASATQFAVVPEPSTIAMLTVAFGLVAYAWRKRQK